MTVAAALQPSFEIGRVAVIGAGVAGRSFALACAGAGFRVVLEDVVDPLTGEIIVEGNTELDEARVDSIENAGIEEVVIRSVLTCQTRRGVCALCYGRDLARGYRVRLRC